MNTARTITPADVARTGAALARFGETAARITQSRAQAVAYIGRYRDHLATPDRFVTRAGWAPGRHRSTSGSLTLNAGRRQSVATRKARR